MAFATKRLTGGVQKTMKHKPCLGANDRRVFCGLVRGPFAREGFGAQWRWSSDRA